MLCNKGRIYGNAVYCFFGYIPIRGLREKPAVFIGWILLQESFDVGLGEIVKCAVAVHNGGDFVAGFCFAGDSAKQAVFYKARGNWHGGNLFYGGAREAREVIGDKGRLAGAVQWRK